MEGGGWSWRTQRWKTGLGGRQGARPLAAAFLGEKTIFHLMLWCEEGREMGYKELGQRREREGIKPVNWEASREIQGRKGEEGFRRVTHTVWGFPFSGKEESDLKLRAPLRTGEVPASISAPWLKHFPGAAAGSGTMNG